MEARMSDKIEELLDNYRKRYRPRWIDLAESLLGRKVKDDEFIKKLKDEYELAQHEYIECLERETEMKIKNDYVTNSSSTSFCGWGIQIFDLEREDIPKKFLDEVYNNYLEHCKKHNIPILPLNKFCLESLILNENGERDDNHEVNRWYFQFFKIIAEKYHLFCEVDSFSKEFIIGKSSLEIPDDMTAGFYKEAIRVNLERIGFDKERISEIFTIID